MNCPNCGTQTGGVSLVVGFVRLETHKCKNCGRVWRMKSLLVPFNVTAFAEEIDRLQKKHPAAKPSHVKVALTYLQIKLDDHATSKLEKEAATKKRRLDLWERNFIREAEGGGYQ